MYEDVVMADTDLLNPDDFWDGEEDWFELVDDEFVDEFDDDIDEEFDDEIDEDVRDLVEWEDSFYEALGDNYADAAHEELADAMSNVFASLTPAESFNIGKALGQIGKGAAQVLADPTVAQIAATAAPIAGGAVGTVLGGPVGTAVGTSLGAAAGKAIAPKRAPAAPATPPIPTPVPTAPARPTTAATTPPKPPAAQGSAAATKALVSSQQPDVLKALLALTLGQHGRRDVNGIPVGAVMNMLSALYAEAAEDADELLYASEGTPAYMLDAEGFLNADPASPAERADALYAALIGAENQYLAEVGLA